MKSIKTLLIITLALLVTEMLNVVLMTTILGSDLFNNMMSSTPDKYYVGLPAALLFALIMVFAYYFLLCKKKKEVSNGTKGS
jgi:uncharacterized BrkB/YihY/UPF0761 family membrane protein